MSGKFTPGPWIVFPRMTNEHLEVRDEEGRRVAVIAGMWPMGPKRETANAHLIAQAPAMLAALKAAVRIKDIWVPSCGVDDEHAGEAQALSKMLTDFENLIARAEGSGSDD